MDIRKVMKMAENIIGNTTKTCCSSNTKLEVIISCSTHDKECLAVAVCPDCRTRYSFDEAQLVQEKNFESVWVCDATTHKCSVA